MKHEKISTNLFQFGKYQLKLRNTSKDGDVQEGPPSVQNWTKMILKRPRQKLSRALKPQPMPRRNKKSMTASANSFYPAKTKQPKTQKLFAEAVIDFLFRLGIGCGFN